MRFSASLPTVQSVVLIGTKFYNVQFKGGGYFSNTLVSIIEKQKDNLIYAICLLENCPDLEFSTTDFTYLLYDDSVIMTHKDIEGQYSIESLEQWLEENNILSVLN